jgi:hypothetical protein
MVLNITNRAELLCFSDKARQKDAHFPRKIGEFPVSYAGKIGGPSL